MRRLWPYPGVLLILLGACALPPQAPTAESGPASAAPAGASAEASPEPEITRGKPGSLLAKVDRARLSAQLKQAPRPINLQRRCAFRNETGYNGSTQVDIADSRVRVLNTQINVPNRGACAFDWNGFEQTRTQPSIELRHPSDGCTVRIWQQGRQVTIAYSHCARRCASADTFKYVWPVLIDTGSDACD